MEILQRGEVILVEDTIYQSCALDIPQRAIVATYDTATLLTAVLQRVQTIVADVGSILRAVDAKDTTLFVQSVIFIFFVHF